MNMIEAYAITKKGKCACKPVIFVITCKAEIQKIPVFSGKKNPSLYDQMFPVKYRFKKVRRWNAYCNQCNCLYFSSFTKGRLIENLKKCNFDYIISKGEKE